MEKIKLKQSLINWPWLKKCKVKAKSISDYLKKYYKSDRITKTLLQTYKQELIEFGLVRTSKFDNVTGKYICWWPH